MNWNAAWKAPGATLKAAPFHSAADLAELAAYTDVVIAIVTPHWLGVETPRGQRGWFASRATGIPSMKKRIPLLRSLPLLLTLFIRRLGPFYSVWASCALRSHISQVERRSRRTTEGNSGVRRTETSDCRWLWSPLAISRSADMNERFTSFLSTLCRTARTQRLFVSLQKSQLGYADRDPSKSGYQVLPSNGRLELDLLDRLSDRLGGKPLISVSRSSVLAPTPKLDLRTASPGTYVSSGTPRVCWSRACFRRERNFSDAPQARSGGKTHTAAQH